MSGKTKVVSSLFAILLGCAVTAPVAQASSFDDGVRLYQSRQYSAALGRFADASRTAPSNAMVHYYMGLCYQATNQMSLAKQQYEWVAAYASNNPSLQNNARTAISQLSRYTTSWSSGNSFPSTTGSAVAASPRVGGRLKIMEFYSDT